MSFYSLLFSFDLRRGQCLSPGRGRLLYQDDGFLKIAYEDLSTGHLLQLINKLQSVLRSAARLVLRKWKFDRITDDLRDQLHWLPIRQRIQYKLGLLVYKYLHGAAPSYLADMISPVGNGSQRLRSAAHGNLAVPPTRTARMGPRSFPVSGPTLWNSLPVDSNTMHIPFESFKSKLKTYLFTKAYDPWLALWYGMVSHWLYGHILEKFLQQLKTTLFGRAGVGSASE